MSHFWLQLVAFLFAPVLLPIYLVSLPFIALFLRCRQCCCRRAPPPPTMRGLLRKIWGSDPTPADRNDPEGLNRLADAIGQRLEVYFTTKLQAIDPEEVPVEKEKSKKRNCEIVGCFGDKCRGSSTMLHHVLNSNAIRLSDVERGLKTEEMERDQNEEEN